LFWIPASAGMTECVHIVYCVFCVPYHACVFVIPDLMLLCEVSHAFSVVKPSGLRSQRLCYGEVGSLRSTNRESRIFLSRLYRLIKSQHFIYLIHPYAVPHGIGKAVKRGFKIVARPDASYW